MKAKVIISLLGSAVVALGLLAFKNSENNYPTGIEYKTVTVVESIVPMGLGRSRIIEENEDIAADDLTTNRVDGKNSSQGSIKRRDIKIDNFSETKILNFYSGVGINFQNVASNDAVVTDKINRLGEEGWVLAHVTSGVESDAGSDDGKGIYITRLIFSRAK